MIRLRTNGEKAKVVVSTHKATPEELAEHHDYAERSDRLLAMQSELMEKYPDQHVALTKGGNLVVADSMPELVAKIEALGERAGPAATLFLETNPRRVIL